MSERLPEPSLFTRLADGRVEVSFSHHSAVGSALQMGDDAEWFFEPAYGVRLDVRQMLAITAALSDMDRLVMEAVGP